MVSWQDDIGPAGPHRIEALERVVFGHIGIGLLDFFIVRTIMFQYEFCVEGDRIVLHTRMWPFFRIFLAIISLGGIAVAVSLMLTEPVFPLETLGILLGAGLLWPAFGSPGRFMHSRYRDAARNALSSFPET